MREQTFQKTAREKEDIEWMRVWCEDTNAALPRVLLIGDSITEGYQAGVRARMRGVACVDCLATSYGADMSIYHKMLAAVAADSSYAVIQYNFGLHAFRLDGAAYEQGYAAMLDRLAGLSQVVVATSTRALNAARRGRPGVAG